ncbi:Adenylosuccinate lyase [Posidoniimonas polymericola]|uniref:Adenylosuccinate lyase n=1 Tax=Posidoniimonas polymericola TaxID=2528002 RepID=A0A5C5YTF2_9BACT|nr:adenylosuccinate lyase [Posidoniimonas polymericola]TWT78013.1 Adenylosuccinate lyase [Posidoniimonas polymericola]
MSEYYENPLITRYASRQMAALWGAQKKFSTWRRLWVALAEAEAELGLPISEAQLNELRENVDKIDFDNAAAYEKKLRHDVMAHVHAYGDQCPGAKAIIHLGATSNFVVDNTDLILLRESLELVRDRIVAVIQALDNFAREHRALPTLGFTHMQPAQPTTVGKRATLWCYDLVLDLQEVEHRIAVLCARSTKGTTGTQASFLELFDGDHTKVRELETLVAQKMGFQRTYAVTGQTYPRGVDTHVLSTLGGVAASCHKAATDIRLLANRKELEEPFEKNQIGSSAMAYKRNPMRSERICGLARFVMSLTANGADTHATQWMERTLDDSANRRLSLPQALLGVDAVLSIYHNVASGLVVYPKVIERNLAAELPFMATENLLMEAVRAGGDRQDLHEVIRTHSQEAAAVVKQQGGDNDLLDRLRNDPAFAGVDIDAAVDAAGLVGRAPEQVDEFLNEVVEPILVRLGEQSAGGDELRV